MVSVYRSPILSMTWDGSFEPTNLKFAKSARRARPDSMRFWFVDDGRRLGPSDDSIWIKLPRTSGSSAESGRVQQITLKDSLLSA